MPGLTTRGRAGVLMLPLALAVATGARASEPADTAPRFTQADVRFMQHMIWHHAQALAMTSLIADRTTTEPIEMLGGRITVSQRDEIRLMQRWLVDRGQTAPDPAADHGAHMAHGEAPMMPGMLTAEEMGRLAAARGRAFDRLFLEFMIRHHEGALAMVKDLFATPGAAQEAEVFKFASDVEADQRAEIARMRALAGSPAFRG